MPYITSEDAVDRVQAREDAIREASAKLDDGISALCDVFNLPPILTQGWESLLASRIASQHEAHVSSIRQQLRLDSHNLRMFHARPSTKLKGTDGDTSSSTGPSPTESDEDTRCAAARLVALLVEAFQRSRKVESLYKEFDDLQAALTVNGLLSLPDIVFIRKTNPDLTVCRDKLLEDAAKMKDEFTTFKTCFYLLSDETELNKVMRVARNTTVPADVFATHLAPTVETLLRLTRERAEAVEKAATITEELMIEWLSLSDAHLDQEVFDAAVAQFDPLQTLITEQEAEHNSSLTFVTLMFEVALNTPTSLPFSDGKIDVELLLTAFDHYEKLTELSREMIEASGPVVETLVDFVSKLRLITSPVA